MVAAPDLRVLLVEDSAVICRLIEGIVNSVPGVIVAGSVDSESGAIEAVMRGDVDVLILDLQLRSGTGFGVLRAMRGTARQPVVVVLTNFALNTYRDSALALGARHFLDKSRDYDRLPEILTEIAAARTS
jgi:DNA-binding NarL/FixJ family response regulator